MTREQGEGKNGAAGADGDEGEKGNKGDQGNHGDKGDQGDQGVKGNNGVKGDDGVKGEKGDKGDNDPSCKLCVLTETHTVKFSDGLTEQQSKELPKQHTVSFATLGRAIRASRRCLRSTATSLTAGPGHVRWSVATLFVFWPLVLAEQERVGVRPRRKARRAYRGPG